MPPGRTSRIAAELRTLPRQFWLLAAVTFVYLIGVEMCYPFETIYLRDVLGVSVTAIGLIVGVTLFATLPMQVVGGALCDRYGRRPILAVAIVGSMTLYYRPRRGAPALDHRRPHRLRGGVRLGAVHHR
ncbi:MAG TPA: MFS transporter [Thermoleophilia bacterium]|nr:MFS transporter [Thermoleophilia bacterium]